MLKCGAPLRRLRAAVPQAEALFNTRARRRIHFLRTFAAQNATTMNFSIPVTLPSAGPRLDAGSRVLTLGSCFAQHMGERLCDALPDGCVEVNPFGVLYNPASIAAALGLLLAGGPLPDDLLFCGRDGLWHSWQHATPGFSAPERAACADNVRRRLNGARRLLDGADTVVLTFGTAHVYELRERPGLVVANCHKEPAARFIERRLAPHEAAGLLATPLAELHRRYPGLQVVLTVSPYRYTKLGLHGSTLSKAVLHLACEELCARFGFVSYFPAYEIVVDELRDYRFYERDMLHPSAVAVDYVCERFAEWTFTPALRAAAAEREARLRRERHRDNTAARPRP